MTTIRTAFPQSEVQSLDALHIDRLRLNPIDRDVTNLQITRGGPVVAGINVLTADLKAALGIDELGCGARDERPAAPDGRDRTRRPVQPRPAHLGAARNRRSG